jgi:stress response protein YsnF
MKMALSGIDNLGESDPQPLSSEMIQDFDVFGMSDERIGKVVAIERSAIDQYPFVVLKVGSWLSSRQVLVPLRHYQVDMNQHRLYLREWTKESIEQLHTYSPIRTQSLDASLEAALPLESVVPLEQPVVRVAAYAPPVEPSVDVHREAIDPEIHEVAPEVSPRQVAGEAVIPLLAERVVVDRQRRKSGEVVVRKVIETEIIEVQVRREKLIVEQVSPSYKELAVIDLGQTSIEKRVLPKE